jgi:hypothetical protein
MQAKVFNDDRYSCGHTLVELVAAMVASAVLLAGLGSLMLIARQVAYTPSGASRRTDAAHVISELTGDLQYATLLIGQSPTVLEFVVADRNADGTAEKFRYEWSGTPGEPLRKSINGGTPFEIAENIHDCDFDVKTVVVQGSPTARTYFTHALMFLQSGTASHSRIDAAVPLISQPEWLAPSPSYWRTDFDVDPTSIDADCNFVPDWVASQGATFISNPSPGQLTDGTWYANGELSTNTSNDFTGITIVEARCKNMAASGSVDVLRIDRQSGAYSLIVRLQRQLDGSQMFTLLSKPTSSTEQVLKVVENLIDDYLKFQLIVLPNVNQVSLRINDAGDDVLGGPFSYAPPPAATYRRVTIRGDAKFDYVDVRVLDN